jgi:hypothetical protein
MGKPYGIREECVCLLTHIHFNHHQFPVKPGELSGAFSCGLGTNQLPDGLGCIPYTATSSGMQRNGASPKWPSLKTPRSPPTWLVRLSFHSFSGFPQAKTPTLGIFYRSIKGSCLVVWISFIQPPPHHQDSKWTATTSR